MPIRSDHIRPTPAISGISLGVTNDNKARSCHAEPAAAAVPKIHPLPSEPPPPAPPVSPASISKPFRVSKSLPPRREPTPAEWARIYQAMDEAPPIFSSEDDPDTQDELRDHLTSHGMWTGR